jgi:MFS family permease
MHPISEVIQSSILSRQAIGIALIVAITAFLYANRSLMADIASDPARGWRIVARAAAVLGAITLVWVTVVDDWLQLVVEPYRRSMKWEYQRVQFDPIDPALRLVSIVLLAAAMLLLAMLVARHISGYVFQIGALVVSVLAWIPLFILNQRLNALILQGAANDASLAELAGLTTFWLVRLAFGLVMVAASIAAATLVTSLVVSVLLDMVRAREPRTTHEAEAFFATLHQRAEETPDRPVHSYWRPIERPL